MATKEPAGLLRLRHAVACAVHTGAFIFLLAYASHKSDGKLSTYRKQFWVNLREWSYAEPRRWLFNCFVNNTFVNTTRCDDDDKRFFVEEVEYEYTVNILLWATFYVGWSALLHGIASWKVEWTRELRWFDYMVTAPTMLFVVALAFGSDSITVLIIMPIVLAKLLFVGWMAEQRTTFTRYAGKHPTFYRFCTATERWLTGGSNAAYQVLSQMRRRRQIAIAVIFVLYVPTVLPVLLNSWEITQDKHPLNNTTGVGEAPPYVFWFALITVLLFSSFAILYWWNLWHDTDREKYYIYLSMLSKTSLHLFLALAVIGQSNVISVATPDPSASDMDTVRKGIIGSLILVVVLAIITLSLGPLYNCCQRGKRAPKEYADTAMQPFL